ncbi:MAG: hypothetical protein E7D34_19590 [Klebsiella sp.]|nr:hypothetical protein [Klebsiella sp.]
MLVKRLFFQHIEKCYLSVVYDSGGKQKMTQTVTTIKCNSIWFAQGKGLFL